MATNLASLREKTEWFRATFYDSTLPYWLLDCLTSQAAIIRHIGVVFRIANGDVYGWEGRMAAVSQRVRTFGAMSNRSLASFPTSRRKCAGSTSPPAAHRRGINNRTDVPSPPRPTGEQPFADGHASCILKAYREALNHPDDTLFNDYWPHVKRAVEYLIARDAAGTGASPTAFSKTISGIPMMRRCTASRASSAAITWPRCGPAKRGPPSRRQATADRVSRRLPEG